MKISTIMHPQFQKVLSDLTQQPVPMSAAFKLKGIVGQIENEMRSYDETRKTAIQRLADKNTDGSVVTLENGSAKFSDENLKIFVQELNDLLASEIEIGSITLASLGDRVIISASDLAILDSLIKE